MNIIFSASSVHYIVTIISNTLSASWTGSTTTSTGSFASLSSQQQHGVTTISSLSYTEVQSNSVNTDTEVTIESVRIKPVKLEKI